MSPEQITRPILWNVGLPTKIAMYVLLAVSLAVFGYGLSRRIKVWRRGRQTSAPLNLSAACRRLLRHVFLQRRIARIPWAWSSHMLLFYGFIVLFIGTVCVALEDYGVFHFFYGTFYLTLSCLLDLFGLGFVVALAMAMARRAGVTQVRPSSTPVDAAILWLLMAIGISGFLIEGLRIAALRPDFEQVSFVGWALAGAWARAGFSPQAAVLPHFAFWWLHMLLVFGFIALVPYTKLLHFLIAPMHIARTPEHASGHFSPVSLEEVEETGRVGVGTMADFTQAELISFDACTQCRRCETACPAWNTAKPLSPMRVVLDLAAAGEHEGSLHDSVISAETLWSCTTCGACVRQCPVLINQLGAIVELRRHLVGEGHVLGSAQGALRSIAATGNPWGLPRADRAAWAAGLDVPTIDEMPNPEVLFWVGCAGSYDRRNQQVSRALAQIMQAAGVKFAILGRHEQCTGDPARRLGDDFTFLEAAQANVETINATGCRRIVTACAHCFNTLSNEYPDYGGHWQVEHHTKFIADLLAAGRLQFAPGAETGAVTFHDPCYLSRHNGGADAPRAVLGAVADKRLPIVEPEQHGPNGFCCGAGGGRMWMEEDIDKRVNFRRFAQLKATGAKTVAVGCPFCMTMLDDASKNDEAAGIAVKDVAELVAARLA
ncbi:MAG: 4Fe-4S dicluster domain-containing protein [Pirellulales bacterium]|nr:4Fe-4S dicluster domain-containing protein [Pirellulales bacterium]